MTAEEEVVALKAEKEHYLRNIHLLNVEKVALDESYVGVLREKLSYHKELILVRGELVDEKNKVTELENKIKELASGK